MLFTAGNSISLQDVLFGDVWVCSGQSNMELTMERVSDVYADILANANNPHIRQFEVPDRYDFKEPQADVAAGSWLAFNQENAPKFSAVAYFFARELYERYEVPVGLINSAMGGSPAEAWISEEAVKEFPDYHTEMQKFRNDQLIADIEKKDQEAGRNWYARLNQTDEGLRQDWFRPDVQDREWATMEIPGYWAEGPMGEVNGVVWFRKEITLPAEMAGKPARLLMGRIVDADSVFINGEFVGTTSYQYPPRRYTVPAGILQEGTNEIAIRVINERGRGGFVPDKPYKLIVGQDSLDLRGSWKYRQGTTMKPAPGQTFIRWKPVGLYNAMIAPLTSYAIKGVIWYQGESNTKNPGEYAGLMETLIRDWREQWKQGDFPFLFVQLTNFMEAKAAPSESSWAELRQAQLETLSVPNTAMAVAIDVGEWNDIHPLNKQAVGQRLALQAAHLVYGDKDVVPSGPLFEAVRQEGNKLVLSFTHTGSGLVAKDGQGLQHFAIAGKDGKFKEAKAEIRGNQVVVWHDAIEQPVAVRYAWADNPQGANLYNKEGLPASPFEATVDEQ